MVTFECSSCIKVLKKKQIENHYRFECKGAHSFCCLTCYKCFDRESIVAHTACITEQEKYKMNEGKKQIIIQKLTIKNVDLDELKWSGFRKTTKKILMGNEGYKLAMKEVFERLAHVYSVNKKVKKEEVCLDKLKKTTLSKLEDDERFVLDLSKHIIRYKA